MKLSPNKVSVLLLTATLCWASSSNADDTATTLDYMPHFGEDGWDLKLGAGVVYYEDLYLSKDSASNVSVDLLASAAYRNGRFYFVAEESDGLLFGYNLKNKDQWVLDAVLGPKFGMIFDDNDLDPRLKHLDDRDVDLHLGGRASYYGLANRTSFILTKDISGAHHGFTASLEYLHQWQIKNFLLTGRAKLDHYSEQLVNHMMGVSASEATAEIPEYQADSATSLNLSIKLEYPISENWVFETYAQSIQFSEEVKDSPLVDDGTVTDVHIGLIYQFGDE